ncbi:uncharacterized protein TNCV_327151 [Trichonephila clavipes]|nr:uncharacterized protein TNCV_327151 [Trichonephila clavipes]
MWNEALCKFDETCESRFHLTLCRNLNYYTQNTIYFPSHQALRSVKPLARLHGTKNPLYNEFIHVKSVRPQNPYVGVVWKLGEEIQIWILSRDCGSKTVLEAKREEFVDDALIYAKSLCEELEISFEPPRGIRRKHIFGDRSKDVQLLYENYLRRTMFSSIDRVTAEIREIFQQLQNLEQKCAFLRPEMILSRDELN